MSLLLWAAMEAALQEAGYGPSPWYPEFKALLQVITNTWTSSVMSFMSDNCIDHRYSPQHQDGWILTERLVPHGKLYKTGSLVAIINRYDTMP
jgi:hypothetical protein